MTMTKKDQLDALAVACNVTPTEAGRIYAAMTTFMADSLLKHRSLRLFGCGIFNVRATAGRLGTNPRTGARIKIPAGAKVTFTPGLIFRDVARRAVASAAREAKTASKATASKEKPRRSAHGRVAAPAAVMR